VGSIMKPVAKLWYNKKGELLLMKEWIEQPIIDLGPNPDGTDYAIADERVEDYERDLTRIKAESLLVLNQNEILDSLAMSDDGFNGVVEDWCKQNLDHYFDLPGATWEEKSHSDYGNCGHRCKIDCRANLKGGPCIAPKIVRAFIHLPETSVEPKERGAGDDCPVIAPVNPNVAIGWEQSKIQRQNLFNYLSDHGFIALESELDEVQNIIAPELTAAHKRIDELEAWKESEMKVWGPVIEYAQENRDALGIRLGSSISSFVLTLMEMYSGKRSRIEHVIERMKAIIHGDGSAQEKIDELKKRLPK